MFDIGFSELFVVAIVALMVLGPERLPRAARFTGLWVRRARAQWYSVKSELERELADDELKKSLVRTRDELRELGNELQSHGRELQDDLRREGKGIEQSVKDAVAPVTKSATGTVAPAIAQDPGQDADKAPAEAAATPTAPVSRP
ncbi:Sec-independent protein translocase protein TatB [Novilysobacter antarcticus]|uniref:Sec-independent protein translocase protein TatB n=1 Tax=Novilysobacter antarcticus TaxID=2862543 RepID=UPI001FEAF112|nr:Sec-independent protein translocase protein TatB [Lysobacter antarcticus]